MVKFEFFFVKFVYDFEEVKNFYLCEWLNSLQICAFLKIRIHCVNIVFLTSCESNNTLLDVIFTKKFKNTKNVNKSST